MCADQAVGVDLEPASASGSCHAGEEVAVVGAGLEHRAARDAAVHGVKPSAGFVEAVVLGHGVLQGEGHARRAEVTPGGGIRRSRYLLAGRMRIPRRLGGQDGED